MPLARVFFPHPPAPFRSCAVFLSLSFWCRLSHPPASNHNSLDLESRGGVPGWSCIVCLGLPKTHDGRACVEQEGTRSERRPGDSCCPFPTDMTVFVEGKATRKVFLSWRTLAGSTEKLRRSGRPSPGPQRWILLGARVRSVTPCTHWLGTAGTRFYQVRHFASYAFAARFLAGCEFLME